MRNHLPFANKITLSLLLGSALGFSPFTANAAPTKTLTVAVAQDPGSWDPIDTYLVNWSIVANDIFDGLTARGADMKIRPALATRWQFRNNNKTIRFYLRQGVTFQDGEPFNAKAVKFTFDRLLSDKASPQRSNYTAIQSVQIINKHTVDFHLSHPDPVLLTKLAGYGAMIVPPEYIRKKGDAYFNTHPIGTGPFKMTNYQPNVSATLTRYDHFWGDKPKLNQVVNLFIKEPSTQVAELESGRVDIITQMPISLIKNVNSRPNLKVISRTGPTTYALRFNTQSGITKNLQVRKALIMAVDRNAIIQSILDGQAKPITSFQSSLSFGYDPKLKPIAFNQQKAKALLKAAGVKPGARVSIDFRGNNATFREVTQAVAGYLSMVGIRATIKPYDSNVFLNDIVPNGKTGEMFQQSWGGWTFDYDNTAYLLYHSGQTYNPYNHNTHLDTLLDKQRKLVDPKKRLPILQSIAAYVYQQHWEMPLYNLNTIYGVNKRVKNFAAPADERFRLTHVTIK